MITGNKRSIKTANSMVARWGVSYEFECKCDGCSKIFWIGRSKKNKEIKRNCNIWCSMSCAKQFSHCAEDNAAWKGGNDKVSNNGYIWAYVGPRYPGNHNGRMLKHRFVMEQFLGRSLKRKESVHHKDGNKQNNDLSNLELWKSTHCSGIKVQLDIPVDYQI